VLNGAGVRTKVVFDIYVAACISARNRIRRCGAGGYGQQARGAALLYSMSSAKLMAAFKSAIEANHSEPS